MQVDWLNREGNQRVIIFMLGWASSPALVENVVPEGYDAVCVYDYRDIGYYLDSNEDFLFDNDIRPDSYSESYLVAWSFGVWAAERLLQNIEFDKAIALNGTPFPIHDTHGIPSRVMDITISGLAKKGLEMFDHKVYGEYYDQYPEKHYPATTEALVMELEILNEYARHAYKPSIQWNQAIIGLNDKIFPVENMRNYWNGLAELLPLYHFPFVGGKLISEQIG